MHRLPCSSDQRVTSRKRRRLWWFELAVVACKWSTSGQAPQGTLPISDTSPSVVVVAGVRGSKVPQGKGKGKAGR